MATTVLKKVVIWPLWRVDLYYLSWWLTFVAFFLGWSTMRIFPFVDFSAIFPLRAPSLSTQFQRGKNFGGKPKSGPSFFSHFGSYTGGHSSYFGMPTFFPFLTDHLHHFRGKIDPLFRLILYSIFSIVGCCFSLQKLEHFRELYSWMYYAHYYTTPEPLLYISCILNIDLMIRQQASKPQANNHKGSR